MWVDSQRDEESSETKEIATYGESSEKKEIVTYKVNVAVSHLQPIPDALTKAAESVIPINRKRRTVAVFVV